MNKLTTNGVTVAVEVEYSPRNSNPEEGQYVFAYQITIINECPDTVQLLRRKWSIFDSIGERREVKGDGVIGEQPILKPGQIHRYNSWSPLRSMMGNMSGNYTMVNLTTNKEFDVEIPQFELVTAAKMN